jgi:adenylate cyclase
MNFEESVLEAPLVLAPPDASAPDGGAAVSREDELAELRRVLDSPDFPATPRNRAFLEYIVRRELAGEGGSLTAYRIATSVFGRSEMFNTLLDPIVRIEAGKLRRDLETYYLKSGARNAWRISIPKGAYRPVFRRAEEGGGALYPAGETLSAEPRAELRRVLDSPDFPATPRNRRFLEFVAEKVLCGHVGRIEAHEIGTKVFGRGEKFDPLADPIVRIEAGKLRRDLETYYLKSGRRNPLRIELPRGGYRPQFVPAG